MSGQLQAPVALLPGKELPVPIGCEHPRAGLDEMEKWKVLTLQGPELRPLYRPARSSVAIPTEVTADPYIYSLAAQNSVPGGITGPPCSWKIWIREPGPPGWGSLKWNSKIWPWVLRDFDPRVTALARPRSNCTVNYRPTLSSDRVPHIKKPAIVRERKEIWSWDTDGVRTTR
jgi:hypothetical protein